MCSNNLKLPIRAAPYKHQREAFYFVLRLFGLLTENEGNDNEKDDGSSFTA